MNRSGSNQLQGATIHLVVDSPVFCGFFISPWSFWKRCPGFIMQLTFSVESCKGSRVCVSGCDEFFVYSTTVSLNCFPHFSPPSQLLGIVLGTILQSPVMIFPCTMTKEYIGMFGMFQSPLHMSCVLPLWYDTSPPEVEEHVGRGVQWITRRKSQDQESHMMVWFRRLLKNRLWVVAYKL